MGQDNCRPVPTDGLRDVGPKLQRVEDLSVALSDYFDVPNAEAVSCLPLFIQSGSWVRIGAFASASIGGETVGDFGAVTSPAGDRPPAGDVNIVGVGCDCEHAIITEHFELMHHYLTI